MPDSTNETEGTEVKDYAAIPPLSEFLSGNGLLGVDYLHCHTTNIPRAQRSGYSPIYGVPAYTINGEPAMLLGKGQPTPGAVSGIPKVFVDRKLEVAAPVSEPKLKQRPPEQTAGTASKGVPAGV